MAGLGLVLLAALVAGGIVYFLFASPSGRRSQAAERGTRRAPPARPADETDDERAAPPVELVPAGASLVPTDSSPTAAVQSDAAGPAPASEKLAPKASEGDGEVEAPALKYVRNEGKAEVIQGKELRRERRSDRREREAEAAAMGVESRKKPVEAPKKNANRSQIKNMGPKDGKPERPKQPPEETPQDG